nr:MAG: hypothetical protein [Molluscum contagiosum virus]
MRIGGDGKSRFTRICAGARVCGTSPTSAQRSEKTCAWRTGPSRCCDLYSSEHSE